MDLDPLALCSFFSGFQHATGGPLFSKLSEANHIWIPLEPPSVSFGDTGFIKKAYMQCVVLA